MGSKESKRLGKRLSKNHSGIFPFPWCWKTLPLCHKKARSNKVAMDARREVYLVTGASRGIGLEFVDQLLKRGGKVIAGSRSISPALEDLLSKYPEELFNIELDVSNESSIEVIVQPFSLCDLDQRTGKLKLNVQAKYQIHAMSQIRLRYKYVIIIFLFDVL